MKNLLRTLSLGVSVLVLAACQTEPPVPLKKDEMPATFVAPMTKSDQVWPASDWWTGFTSRDLTQLEVPAEQSNLDLAAAAARVVQARGETGLAASALFPTLGLEADASRAGAKQAITGIGG